MRYLLLIPVLLAPLPARADPPTFWEQKMACTADAFRLCASEIPDRERIRDCMERQHDRLSDGCRRVFDASVDIGH